jgi:hypothetical protein
VDPDGLYVPVGLDCASVVGEAGSYADGATGYTGDPVQIARDHLSGLEFDDLVERALYPESEQPVVRVVRDGAVVATVRFFDDGPGLARRFSRCADTPIGSAGRGRIRHQSTRYLHRQAPGEGDNILRLRSRGRPQHRLRRRLPGSACRRAANDMFSNLGAVQGNISIYTMTSCLRDILAEGTSHACPSETFDLPIFHGEIITGVSEIVYELGPLERGEYYFQDDVHPAANGVLIVG